MEIKTPKEFFDDVLPTKFNPAKAAGFEAVIQLNIIGPNGGDWNVTVKDQKMDIRQGVHSSPSLTVTMADSDYVDMINGKLGVERAFMTGKLKFQGSMAIGLKLRDIGFM